MKTILNMDVNTKNNPRDDLGRGSSHRDNPHPQSLVTIVLDRGLISKIYKELLNNKK